MAAYIIKVIVFQALFLGLYQVFLKKETFFQLNRGYLLITPVLALVLPYIKIARVREVLPQLQEVVLLPEVFIGVQTTETIVAEGVSSFPFFTLIYVLGVLVSIGVFIAKYRKITRAFSYRNAEETVVVLPQSNEAFTFLNTVFIGDKIDALSRKRILTHERVHLEQRHTWDLLFFELFKIFMWFNPLVYASQKTITALHEYIADAFAVKQTERKDYFESLLNTAFGTKQLSFINTFFNHSLIKKRITMLQKSKSRKSALLKYGILLPMIAGIITYTSCSEDAPVKEEQTEVMEHIVALSEAIMVKGNLNDEEIRALEFLAKPAKEGDKIYLSVQQYLDETAGETEVVEREIYDEESSEIPFAVIEKVPTYPGCSGSNEELKQCMSEKIRTHVGNEFDASLGKSLGLSGVNRIFVQFKINSNGDIVDVKSRAPHPDLQAEAGRVVSTLPRMKPGEQKGKAVSVLYSLPITFKIEE